MTKIDASSPHLPRPPPRKEKQQDIAKKVTNRQYFKCHHRSIIICDINSPNLFVIFPRFFSSYTPFSNFIPNLFPQLLKVTWFPLQLLQFCVHSVFGVSTIDLSKQPGIFMTKNYFKHGIRDVIKQFPKQFLSLQDIR